MLTTEGFARKLIGPDDAGNIVTALTFNGAQSVSAFPNVPIRVSVRKMCAIDGCESVAKARGFCRIHYRRWHYAQNFKAPPYPTVCAVPECGAKVKCRGLCHRHHAQFLRGGPSLATKYVLPSRKIAGSGWNNGYMRDREDGIPEHRKIAERALGKPLPVAARIHHVDHNGKNNSPGNLVVCPDDAYHMLLHRRERALDACGHPDWLKCRVCKQWDSPSALSTSGYSSYHRVCETLKMRNRRGK